MKPLKILLASLTLLISLPYSGKSQTISIDSKWIKFDSLAAVNLWQDIEVRESIIQLFQEELEKKDSTLNSTTHNLFATSDSLQYWKGKYHTDINIEQKEKRIWQKMAIGASILAAFIAIL